MESEPQLILLSLDYELFFHRSGSVEKCLFEPCDALLRATRSLPVKPTVFVDAGMIIAMRRCAAAARQLLQVESAVSRHVESLARAGWEIQLHVHPHWEDSRWAEGRWDFNGTRYQLSEFTGDEVDRILGQYMDCLATLSGRKPTAYRAGGFCVEPFSPFANQFWAAGISVDSSVVPGALLRGQDRGFDFRASPRSDWWEFDTSPLQPRAGGRFLEVPLSSYSLPFLYYWGRLARRVAGGTAGGREFGDGASRSIGKREILGRLAGRGRVAEISMDHAKFSSSRRELEGRRARRYVHMMGHPKLISPESLGGLTDWLNEVKSAEFETVASLADKVRAGNFREN